MMDVMLQHPRLILGCKYPEAVLPLIERAQRTIDIVIFDWRIYESQPKHPVMLFAQSVRNAHSRGVRVRVLGANGTTRAKLAQWGFRVRELHGWRLVHAKMLLVDGRYAVIGSHNFTQSAFTKNLEISVALDLCADDGECQKYFDGLWGV